MAQPNPGTVSLLEVVGRRGQSPFVELLTVYALLFPQGLFLKAVWGFRWYFHLAQRSSVHTRVSQEGSGLQLHNTMPSSAAAAACVSDLQSSTIAGQITERNTKPGRAASDMLEGWENRFKMEKKENCVGFSWRHCGEMLWSASYLVSRYLNPPDISWLYLCGFILCYLHQLQLRLNREVKVKQKDNLGILKNRIMLAWINFLVEKAEMLY